jgi:hypothetical protein
MAKARIWGNWPPENEKGNVAIYCPGCKTHHVIATKAPQSNGAVWNFNSDMYSPTFSPSLLIRTGSYAVPGFIDPEGITPVICHSFITNGKIQFLGDCTHALKNQTVDLPEVDF